MEIFRLCINFITMSFRKKIKPYTITPLSHQIVSDVLGEYLRPNDKINELVKSGDLISLRRGLYVPGPELDLPVPENFLIANHLRGPSYISLESALSYWGMIPERVYEICSVTTKTSKTYQNTIGRFSYQHLPSPYYSLGVTREEMAPQQIAMIATREKAICDKIILTSGVLLRSVQQTRAFLVEDLRIDESSLGLLNPATIQEWIAISPKKESLKTLIKTLENL